MSIAAVLENSSAASHRVDQKVQIAIPVNVGQDGACRNLAAATNAGRVRDIFKLPVAEIAVEFVAAAVEATKIDITEAVAIHIPQGNTRAVQQILVGDRSLIGNEVGKENPCGFRRQQCEPRFAGLRHRQFAPTIALSRLPIQPGAFSYGSPGRQEQEPKDKCVFSQASPVQKTFHWQSTLVFPPTSTSISCAPAGTRFVVVLPSAHRTQSPVGAWGAPSTCTAPSCDQYPDPA